MECTIGEIEQSTKILQNEIIQKVSEEINLNDLFRQFDPKIGPAYSGIHIPKNEPDKFIFGTESGQVVRVQLLKQNQSFIEGFSQIEKPFKILSWKGKGYGIENNRKSLSIDVVFFPKEDYSIIYQAGQLKNDAIIISSSGEEQNKNLHVYNKDYKCIFQTTGSISSYAFVRYDNDHFIYRELMNWNQRVSLVFCRYKNSEGKDKIEIVRKIMLGFEEFPMTLNVIQDFLYVSLLQESLQTYKITSGRQVFSMKYHQSEEVKKISFSNDGQYMMILKDEIFLEIWETFKRWKLNTINIENILSQVGLTRTEEFSVFLLTFVNLDTIMIGGSFPYLIFLNWKNGQVTKIVENVHNYVGYFVQENLIFVTHEKTSSISLIY